MNSTVSRKTWPKKNNNASLESFWNTFGVGYFTFTYWILHIMWPQIMVENATNFCAISTSNCRDVTKFRIGESRPQSSNWTSKTKLYMVIIYLHGVK